MTTSTPGPMPILTLSRPDAVRRVRRPALVLGLVLVAPMFAVWLAGSAAAFSPDRGGPPAPTTMPTGPTAPSIEVPADGAPFSAAPPEEEELEAAPPGTLDAAPPAARDPNAPLPAVFYGEADLPAPVRERRAAILAAARSGDPEALRPLIEASGTTLSPLGGGDPVDILVAQSGDHAGVEILAILIDVLDAGWVRLDAGTPRERYVWPYFAEYPPEALDARQMVEVFRVLTAGDFEEMRTAGTYVFYRAEIDADGRWRSFMSGE